MAKKEVIQIRLTEEDKERIRHRAEEAGQTMTEYVVTMLSGAPVERLWFASKERYSKSLLAYLIAVADAITDKGAWGDNNAFTWSWKLEEALLWLRKNPYNPKAPEVVAAVIDNPTPDMIEYMQHEMGKFISGLGKREDEE